MRAVLVLEDGTWFSGESFGKSGETFGEVVFNTCMTGYQEVTTDPSYNGQIVTMTYPLIGNYGFNTEDSESFKTHIEGFIVKELCSYPSNWRNIESPDSYFKRNGIVGIKGIDTRTLTQHIRNFGSMYGIISTECGNVYTLVEKISEYKKKKRALVLEVTTPEPIHIEGTGKHIVLLDLGVKYNIIRSLKKRNCEIHVLPAQTSADTILSFEPEGVLFSNGPGDPADLPYVIDNIRKLIGKVPLMGICLGHQLLGLALGGRTYKLKFGHHGGNHPVKDLITGRCYITSQNHNYALMENSLSSELLVTHVNVNDKTIEGIRHKSLPIMSVQYHPEAAPGPEDSAYIFDEFIQLMDN